MKWFLLVLVTFVVVTQAGCRPRANPVGPAEFYWLMNRACSYGDEMSVDMLLKAGADPSGVRDYQAFHQSAYQPGYEPSWPINQAADGGHADVVRLLLRAGAKAHAPEGEGQTALTIAARHGHAEVVRLLLEAGVDRSYRAPADGGFLGTAEEIARKAGHVELAETIRRFREQ